MTKDQAVEQLVNERAKVKTLTEADEMVRKELSILLGKFKDVSKYTYGNEIERKVDVQSWMSIAFLIGKLTENRDYTNMVERVDSVDRAIHHLEMIIKDQANP